MDNGLIIPVAVGLVAGIVLIVAFALSECTITDYDKLFMTPNGWMFSGSISHRDGELCNYSGGLDYHN